LFIFPSLGGITIRIDGVTQARIKRASDFFEILTGCLPASIFPAPFCFEVFQIFIIIAGLDPS
jgi:hypothetical protein